MSNTRKNGGLMGFNGGLMGFNGMIPSGYVKQFAIENDHRKSGFIH